MISAISAGKIFSTLGNDKSLVPMAIKDIANSCGLTAGSYVSGDKLEGKDRFIDEFGTQAIWLFGIPGYKKAIDLTLYKSLNVDPEFDVRNLKKSREKILKKSISYADSSIKDGIKNAVKNPKFTKNLALGKFIASTALTIISYAGLTKYRHKVTEKAAEKEIRAEIQDKRRQAQYSFTGPQWNLQGKKGAPTFTGGLENFMYNPVKNLMILDGSITAERLGHSRNKQDFVGYAIKEGTFWTFMYFASKPIQKFLEKRVESSKTKHCSIDLDARVIESEELQNAFKDGSLQKSAEKVLSLEKPEQMLEFIHKNPDDFTVKMAKMSDVLPVLKESNQPDNVDYRQFIDFDEFKGVAEKLQKLNKKFEEFKQSDIPDKSVDGFLKLAKKLKRASTLINIGTCIGVLGVAAPLTMIAARKFGKNNEEFQVKEDIRKRLELDA